MAEAIKEAKLKRRTAKAALTRNGKALTQKIEGNRPIEEITEALQSLTVAYNDLVAKHEDFAEMLEDDEAFRTEEEWLEECQEVYLSLEGAARDHTKAALKAQQPEMHKATPPTPAVKKQTDADETACGFKVEKPKMPQFSGDVREYITFRSDFRHIVESRYGKRDAVALLRTSLNGKPLELIRGIGKDYDTGWDYLDSIYGDPRYVADTVTQDLTRFRPLREGEDARFCELVHLVRRSFNTLKEVGRPHDMDNNHMLALIEQRMCIDDRKVWSRHLERECQQATLENLMAWMTAEMKSRMRATASLRNGNQQQPPRSIVSHISSNSGRPSSSHKCWICQTSSHWVDQCPRFTSLSPSDRLKAVKENHACF